MAKGFAKTLAFASVAISFLGFGDAAARDWSGTISDVELAAANASPSMAVAISSPFSFPMVRADLGQQSIRVAALDTGVGSITEAVVSLSVRLHVSYP